jgi:hypothetical protein
MRSMAWTSVSMVRCTPSHEQCEDALHVGVEAQRQAAAFALRGDFEAAMRPHRPGERLELEEAARLADRDPVVRGDAPPHRPAHTLAVERPDATVA